MQSQSCLLFHFRSCKILKKSKTPLVVQLYHTAGAGQLLNNCSDSSLPVKGKSTLCLCFRKRRPQCKWWMRQEILKWKPWGEEGEQILNQNTSLESWMQMISVLLLPVVLFSQQSRMFLFLIIARPDAKFSSATCCISEKANSWFLLRWTPGE